jgi:ABC-2 type transport system permease protein
MSRMLLIASREYLENVRTKGFWIGILMMPFVLLLVAFVPVLIESTRVAKTYAVIDQTGEALVAVNRLIDRQDFKYFLTEFKKGEEQQLPSFLATIFPELRALTEKQTNAFIDFVFLDTSVDDTLSRRLRNQLLMHRNDIRLWWSELLPEDRARLSQRISTNKYYQVSTRTNAEDLNTQIESGELFAYFIIDADALEKQEGSRYVSNNLTDQDLKVWFSEFVNQEIRNYRLTESQIDADKADWINGRIEFDGVKLGKDGSEQEVDTTDIAHQWAPVAFVYFLWISILINTQMLINNTIEEKSNKLIEVLLSSVSPITLMGGKIIGIAATGLTIVVSWLAMAMAFFIGLPLLLGVELSFDLSSVITDPWFLMSFVMYFLLGYLLYAALLVGLGSLCNNLREAQNLVLPVQMVQMIPILLMIPIGRDPNGTLAQVLSYIPPLTPFVMMNRAAAPPSTFEYVVTTLLLIVSIVVAFWLAAKIFRVGILLTGKPPGPMEILKLLRAPVIGLKPSTAASRS